MYSTLHLSARYCENYVFGGGKIVDRNNVD